MVHRDTGTDDRAACMMAGLYLVGKVINQILLTFLYYIMSRSRQPGKLLPTKFHLRRSSRGVIIEVLGVTEREILCVCEL